MEAILVVEGAAMVLEEAVQQEAAAEAEQLD
jgi:hypothetical protein